MTAYDVEQEAKIRIVKNMLNNYVEGYEKIVADYPGAESSKGILEGLKKAKEIVDGMWEGK